MPIGGLDMGAEVRTRRVYVLAYMVLGGRPHVMLSSSRDEARQLLPNGTPDEHMTKTSIGSFKVWEGSGLSNQLDFLESKKINWHQRSKGTLPRLNQFQMHPMARVGQLKIARERRLISEKKDRRRVINRGLKKALWTLSQNIYR